jgi:hypothetical protein
VVLEAEAKGTDEHERLPRILFFRTGGRFSANKPAVDAIAAFIRASAPPLMV